MFRRIRPATVILPVILPVFSFVFSAHAFSPIVGGDEVGDEDQVTHTTVGLLTDTPQGTGLCTASILASDILVTAAHCVTDMKGRVYPGDSFRIVFNTDIEAGEKSARKAIGARVPSGYKGAGARGVDQYDIAIVRFAGGLPKGFVPAKVLPASQALKKNQTVTLAGYGVITMFLGGLGSGELRKVDTIVSNPTFAKTEVLLDQRQGKGACHGDSGGPATVTIGGIEYLWGVTNRGYPELGPDDCMQFSVYTRITAHASFINQAAKQLRAIK